MPAKVKVIGGPLDGLQKPGSTEPGVSRSTSFAWINAAGQVAPAPRPGTLLYRLEAAGHADEAYVFAGDAYARCDCGGYYRKAEGGRERQPCPMCGAVGAPAPGGQGQGP